LIYPLKIVIFNSYVKLPEGTYYLWDFGDEDPKLPAILGQVLVRKEHDQKDGGEPRGGPPVHQRRPFFGLSPVVILWWELTELLKNLEFLNILIIRKNAYIFRQRTRSQ
jgi:hypothetical protein